MSDEARPVNWFREELERAKKRNASLPKWARPTVYRPKLEPERYGCHCGHPGLGCVCR